MTSGRMRARIVTGVGEWTEAFKSHRITIAKAATDAIRSAGAQIKAEGRADIASAGFSVKWQQALRVDIYPRGSSYSINAAAVIHHKISYAGVFAKNTTIRGKPTLWIPLESAPKKVGRHRVTPQRLEDAGVNLFMKKPHRGKPILYANMEMGRAKFGPTRGGGRFTASQLSRGRQGTGKARTTVAVPLFVGVSAVNIKKRFSIYEIIDRAAGQLARHYAAAFKGD